MIKNLKSGKIVNKLVKCEYFENCTQLLIVISLVCYSIDTLPELPNWVRYVLIIIETSTIIIFSIEFFMRLWAGGTKYLFSLDALIDIAATLPLIIFSSKYTVFFRLIRIFKLMKKADSTKRIREAFHSIKKDLIVVFEICIILIFCSSAVIYHFEHGICDDKFQSIPHSFWWAVITLTTVGYGDVVPQTMGGKIFTAIIVFIGIGIIAIPAGLIASAFNNNKNKCEKKNKDRID